MAMYNQERITQMSEKHQRIGKQCIKLNAKILPTSPYVASPDTRLKKGNRFLKKIKRDPGPFGVVGEEISTSPASPASYGSRCNRKRPGPQRGCPRGDPSLPAPTPPPGPSPGWAQPGAPAALPPPLLGSLPLSPRRRPAEGPFPAGSTRTARPAWHL